MTDTQKTVLVLSLVAAVLATVIYLVPVRDGIEDLVLSVRDLGAIAPVVFFFVFVVAAVAGMSRSMMTVVAGILFSPIVAFTIVILALMLTFMMTYVIARYLAADWVAARLDKVPVAKTLMSAVEQHGFRLLVLMRMNPFVPGVVNGFGFGLTAMNPRSYFLASVLGSLPLTLVYIYLGWVGGESMLRAGTDTQSLQSGTLAVGIIISVMLLTLIGWYGHRALADVRKESSR